MNVGRVVSMSHAAQDARAAIAIDREARRLQREDDAVLVEQVGCWCHAIGGYTSAVPGTIVGGTMHYDACPYALAAKIRGQA